MSIKSILAFFFGCILFASLALFIISKGDIVLFLNKNHTSFWNLYFSSVTKIIEFPFLILFLIILYFKHWKVSAMLASIYLIPGAITQFLKRIIFEESFRPYYYYKNDNLNLVPNVEMIEMFSFPSGHSTIAFAIAMYFSLIYRNVFVVFVSLIMAISVALSRMYLVLHFYQDVVFGAAIGAFIAYLIYLFADKYKLIPSSFV